MLFKIQAVYLKSEYHASDPLRACMASAENGRLSCLHEWSLKGTLNQSVFISYFWKQLDFYFWTTWDVIVREIF